MVSESPDPESGRDVAEFAIMSESAKKERKRCGAGGFCTILTQLFGLLKKMSLDIMESKTMAIDKVRIQFAAPASFKATRVYMYAHIFLAILSSDCINRF